MKRSVWLPILLIILAASYGNTAHAQDDYVVTLKGDTLRGKVKYFAYEGVRYAGAKTKYIQLTPENGKKSTHQVLQTVGFRMNGEIYHTIKYYDGYTFMKLIIGGYLSLYKYQMENQTSWDGPYLVKKDGSVLDVPNLGFKKRVSQFLADCPNVVNNIESGTLGKTELLKIVNDYNACTTPKTNPAPSAKNSPGSETWNSLTMEVKALPDFDKKSDALEMIREIQNKVVNNETVPAFLIRGLKDALEHQSAIQEQLEKALATLAK